MADKKFLLKNKEIATMRGLSKTHFLNDNAKRINKSLGDITGLTGIGVHIIEVDPGHESTEFHRHHHEDECAYVLNGTGVVVLDDARLEIGPGDFIGYPKGGPAHTMLNTGTEVLRCLVVGQRLPQDVADYPDLGKRIYRNHGMPWDLVDHEMIEHPVTGTKK